MTSSVCWLVVCLLCWLRSRWLWVGTCCRSLADVDNNGSLTVDEFCVAMHLVEMTKLGQALPSALPLDLVPPTYRTSVSRSPLTTTAVMNTSRTLTLQVNTPGFDILWEHLNAKIAVCVCDQCSTVNYLSSSSSLSSSCIVEDVMLSLNVESN